MSGLGFFISSIMNIRQPNSEEHRKIICLQQNGATRKEAFKKIMGFDAADLGKKEAEALATDAEIQAAAAEKEANAKKAEADEKRKAAEGMKKAPAKKAPAKKASKTEENWD